MTWDDLQVAAAEVPSGEVGAVVSHPMARVADTDTWFVLDDVDQESPEPRVRISVGEFAAALESGEWIRVRPPLQARRRHLTLVFTPRIHQLLESAGALNEPARPRVIVPLGGFYLAYDNRHQMRAWMEVAAERVVDGAWRAAREVEKRLDGGWQQDEITAALNEQRETVRDAVYLTAQRSSQRRLVYLALAWIDARLKNETATLAERFRAEFGRDLLSDLETEERGRHTTDPHPELLRDTWDLPSESLVVPFI
jgi:hypothetical protein